LDGCNIFTIPLLQKSMINKQVGDRPKLDLDLEDVSAGATATVVGKLRTGIHFRSDAFQPCTAVGWRDCCCCYRDVGQSRIAERDHGRGGKMGSMPEGGCAGGSVESVPPGLEYKVGGGSGCFGFGLSTRGASMPEI
jgi:hypothetical protein